MSQPVLSICIATYNRADYIGETLESIIPQLTDETELLVVDGASTDNTETVMKSYFERSANLRYVRLPIKGGVDQDYDKAVGLARGAMCWLFTDDDLLKPGAVATVLAEIKKGYGLIIVNSEIRNKDLSEYIKPSRMRLSADRIFAEHELDELFRCVIPYLSFIGGVVCNRSLWLEREREPYYGTEFIHVGVIFQTPVRSGALVIADPLIMIRFGNAQWSPRAFEIWMVKWPKLLCSFMHISDESKRNYQTTPSLNLIRRLMVHRSQGTYSLKDYRIWYRGEAYRGLWKYLIWSAGWMPVWLAKCIVLTYVKIYGASEKFRNLIRQCCNRAINK